MWDETCDRGSRERPTGGCQHSKARRGCQEAIQGAFDQHSVVVVRMRQAQVRTHRVLIKV